MRASWWLVGMGWMIGLGCSGVGDFSDDAMLDPNAPSEEPTDEAGDNAEGEEGEEGEDGEDGEGEGEEEGEGGCSMSVDGVGPTMAAAQKDGIHTVTRSDAALHEVVLFADGVQIELTTEACESLTETWTMTPAKGKPWAVAKKLTERVLLADAEDASGVQQCVEALPAGQPATFEAENISCGARIEDGKLIVDFTFSM